MRLILKEEYYKYNALPSHLRTFKRVVKKPKGTFYQEEGVRNESRLETLKKSYQEVGMSFVLKKSGSSKEKTEDLKKSSEFQ